MPATLKALLVVILIAVVVFGRRNVWFILTATAFLSPNFWLFAIVAAAILLWAGRRDDNPIALFLLLMQVIPQVDFEIPVPWNGILFPLNLYRLLTIFVLVPVAWRLIQSKAYAPLHDIRGMQLFLFIFGVSQIALCVPPDLPGNIILHDTFTNFLRRIFLWLLDVNVLYFVACRSCTNKRLFADALGALLLSAALMSAIGLFESARNWLLYAEIKSAWNVFTNETYNLRGVTLRAAASAGHPLALGYLISIAFGFWLYLRAQVATTWRQITVTLLLLLGLLVTYSRGPWLGAAAIFLVFLAFGPRTISRAFRSVVVLGIVGGAVLLSPLGDRIVTVIPFFGGTVGSDSISYRQKLAERSLEIIRDNPFLGDQNAYLRMQDLRQGQGIIDLVNTYAGIAVFYGLIALASFLAFMLVALFKTYRASKTLNRVDPDLSALGLCLVACMAGTLLMLTDSSFILGYRPMFFILAGLGVAYLQLVQRAVAAPAKGPSRIAVAEAA